METAKTSHLNRVPDLNRIPLNSKNPLREHCVMLRVHRKRMRCPLWLSETLIVNKGSHSLSEVTEPLPKVHGGPSLTVLLYPAVRFSDAVTSERRYV